MNCHLTKTKPIIFYHRKKIKSKGSLHISEGRRLRSCLQCQDSSSDCYSNGWKLRSGEYAQLCNSCFSVYKLGRFCEAFHSDEHGWRDCVSCGKLVHCGCIVSLNDYLLLDSSGVVCVDCSKTKSIPAQNHLDVESDKKDDDTRIEPPCGIDLKITESALIPLFQKIVSASDADSRFGRIVIPRKHAEAHFPVVSKPQSVPLSVVDTDGKDWDFEFRCWPTRYTKLYMLLGLKSFMISNNLQAGDTVAFYAKKLDGKIVMELRKTSTVTP